METKIFEVRDRLTFLPVMATLCEASNEEQEYLLRRSGYGYGSNLVMLCSLRGGQSSYDPYSWGDRTFATAHHYIAEHFAELKDGAVIDIEFIKGESTTKKISEKEEIYD